MFWRKTMVGGVKRELRYCLIWLLCVLFYNKMLLKVEQIYPRTYI